MPPSPGCAEAMEVLMSKWVRIAVLAATVLVASGAEAKRRHYYVQAEDVVWDFAPTGQNLIHGGPVPEPWTNSHVFEKTRYIEYTDGSFATQKPQPAWLGVLGPIIRAEVGDTVIAHFRNAAASGSYGMHPHGFRYDKDSEGAHYEGANSGMPPG